MNGLTSVEYPVSDENGSEPVGIHSCLSFDRISAAIGVGHPVEHGGGVPVLGDRAALEGADVVYASGRVVEVRIDRVTQRRRLTRVRVRLAGVSEGTRHLGADEEVVVVERVELGDPARLDPVIQIPVQTIRPATRGAR